MLSSYADAVVIRHKEQGLVSKGALVSKKPVLNAGDGANEHPTQGFLDLYTISKKFGKVEGLTIAFVGDLRNSRTIHSLLPLLSHFTGNTFYFVSPKELALSEEIKSELSEKNISFKETESLDEVLPLVDVLYMTRK
jgi:aspartate carbamoyltransferase catalytic subunit